MSSSELTSLPIRDDSLLPDSQQRLLKERFPEPEYGWRRFRRDVLRAITAAFGKSRVREGKKTLKLVMESPDIPVDVVVAVRYLKYAKYLGKRNYKNIEGLGLYLPTERRWTVSYPHVHRRNGVVKEKSTNWWFRRCIRMFKNARAQLVEEGRLGPATARSYYLECLLYNVPNRLLGGSYQSAYSSALYWLQGNDLTRFFCQNELVPMFDGGPGLVERKGCENPDRRVDQAVRGLVGITMHDYAIDSRERVFVVRFLFMVERARVRGCGRAHSFRPHPQPVASSHTVHGPGLWEFRIGPLITGSGGGDS